MRPGEPVVVLGKRRRRQIAEPLQGVVDDWVASRRHLDLTRLVGGAACLRRPHPDAAVVSAAFFMAAFLAGAGLLADFRAVAAG